MGNNKQCPMVDCNKFQFVYLYFPSFTRAISPSVIAVAFVPVINSGRYTAKIRKSVSSSEGSNQKTQIQYKQQMLINSADLIIPRDTCQRKLKIGRAKRICLEFNEYIANEPKVSCRDGKYYVFDGQHTIAARKLRNGGNDLPILCKVYYGLSEQEEAFLFAMQHGISAPVSTGYRIRSLVFSKQPEAVAFKEATEELGIALDYDHEKGAMRIGCIKAALKAYQSFGKELYQEALKILIEAWGDDPDALRRENVVAMTRFVDLYRKELDRHRLISCLRYTDPLTIWREGDRSGTNFAGDKKYLYQLFRIYNNAGDNGALELKF